MEKKQPNYQRNRKILMAFIAIAVTIFSVISLTQHKIESEAKEDAEKQEQLYQERLRAYVKAHPLTEFFASDFFSGIITFQDIVSQKIVKDRLLVQYSQPFLDMIPIEKGSTAFDYDEKTNCWSCELNEDSLRSNLYYYPATDEIEIVLYIDDLYINRECKPELGEHNLKYPIDESSKEYKEYVENLRAANRTEREEREEHNRYLYNLTLAPVFDSFNYKTLMPEVIAHPKVKARIVSQYSQKFYDMLSIWNDDSAVQYQPFMNEGYYYTYCYATTESGSQVRLSYQSSDDILEVSLTIKGVVIDKWGDYDIGNWELCYFNNEFGEDIKSQPFVLLKLKVDKVNSPYYDEEDLFYIRLSNNDGIAIMYYRGGLMGEYVDNNFKDPTLTIRRESDGEVFYFKLTCGKEHSYIAYIAESQYNQFLELLDNGDLTISYKFQYGLEDYTALERVYTGTKKVFSAKNLL